MHLLQLFRKRKHHTPHAASSSSIAGQSGSRSRATGQKYKTPHGDEQNLKSITKTSRSHGLEVSRAIRPARSLTIPETNQRSRTASQTPSVSQLRIGGSHAHGARSRCYAETQPDSIATAPSMVDQCELVYSDRKLYATLDHPANRPSLPTRPRLQPDMMQSPSLASDNDCEATLCSSANSKPGVGTPGGYTHRVQTPTSPSSTATSFVCTPQSSGASTTSTKATSISSGLAAPRIMHHTALDNRISLGFGATPSLPIPNFGRMCVRDRKGCYTFRISDRLYGTISPKAAFIYREGNVYVYPRNVNLSTILDFEEHQDPGFGRERAKSLYCQLLLSDDISQTDLRYILAAYQWIRRRFRGNPCRLSPIIRVQCNERQRKIYTQFRTLSSIRDNAELARKLTGVDGYDNPLRLLAFLELDVEYHGPFRLSQLLQRISDGRKVSEYQGSRLNHLSKACLESLFDLVATIVYKVGQHLAKGSCTSADMGAAVEGVFRILCFSSEIDTGRIFDGVAPKLQGGEIALCYSLLLATGLGDDTQRAEMWGTLLGCLKRSVGSSADCNAVAVIAIVAVIRWSRHGAQVLFPGPYKELLDRRLVPTALKAWQRLHGKLAVWAALVDEVERSWRRLEEEWDEREAFYMSDGV